MKSLWEGQILFQYDTPEEVMEHLLKSGTGTTFHDAIDPNRREVLEQQFISIQGKRPKNGSKYEVAHDIDIIWGEGGYFGQHPASRHEFFLRFGPLGFRPIFARQAGGCLWRPAETPRDSISSII